MLPLSTIRSPSDRRRCPQASLPVRARVARLRLTRGRRRRSVVCTIALRAGRFSARRLPALPCAPARSSRRRRTVVLRGRRPSSVGCDPVGIARRVRPGPGGGWREAYLEIFPVGCYTRGKTRRCVPNSEKRCCWRSIAHANI